MRRQEEEVMKKSILIFTSVLAFMIGISHLSYIQDFNASNTVAAQSSQWDFGDAPAPYPTLLGVNGARHVNTASEWWGVAPTPSSPLPTSCSNTTSVELDAQATDLDNDDGLCGWWYNPVSNTAFAHFLVSVAPDAQAGTRYLNVLIDLNQDGDWQDEEEWAVPNFPMPLPPGGCQFPVTMALGDIPAAFPYCTWLRFTITSSPIPPVANNPWAGTGEFATGETEDYRLCWDPSFPPGEGGDAPGSKCPVLVFRLTCKSKVFQIDHGLKQIFTLSTTGNVRPNNIEVKTTVVGPCDPAGIWDPVKGTVFSTTPPASVLPLPANPATGDGRPSFTSSDVHTTCVNRPNVASSKLFAWYFNTSPSLGPVGAAGSADTCKCDVLHGSVLSNPLLGIQGKVKDESGGKIAGASILFVNSDGVALRSAKTKSNGKYKTGQSLPAGTYTVMCEMEGFMLETKTVTVGPDNARANFTLRRPSQITGQVALADSFFDVYAVIEITDLSGNLIFKEPTDPQGRYDSERALAPGMYKVKAWSPDFFPEEMNAEIRSGARAEINFNLRRRPPDFYVTCTPSTLRAQQGASVESRCDVTPISGFNGLVSSFQAVDLPAGVTASFIPDSGPLPNVLARSTLRLTVGEGVAPGSYPFKVGATSGSITRFADLMLMVTPRIPDPDFVISCDPASLTILEGQSGQTSYRVTSIDGFAGQVMLACAGLPAGVQCSFDPNPVAPPPNGSALGALTVSVDAGARPGTYSFQVTSVNTDVVRSFTMQLTIVGR